jgi:hypothetical protein
MVEGCSLHLCSASRGEAGVPYLPFSRVAWQRALPGARRSPQYWRYPDLILQFAAAWHGGSMACWRAWVLANRCRQKRLLRQG